MLSQLCHSCMSSLSSASVFGCNLLSLLLWENLNCRLNAIAKWFSIRILTEFYGKLIWHYLETGCWTMSLHTPDVWTDKAWAGRQWWMESCKRHCGQGETETVWRVWRACPFAGALLFTSDRPCRNTSDVLLQPVLNQSWWQGRKFHYSLQFNWHFSVSQIVNLHTLCIWTAETLG